MRRHLHGGIFLHAKMGHGCLIFFFLTTVTSAFADVPGILDRHHRCADVPWILDRRRGCLSSDDVPGIPFVLITHGGAAEGAGDWLVCRLELRVFDHAFRVETVGACTDFVIGARLHADGTFGRDVPLGRVSAQFVA